MSLATFTCILFIKKKLPRDDLSCKLQFISSLISCLIFVETNGAVSRTRTQKPCLSMCDSNPSLLHVTIKTKVGDKKQPLNRVRCPLIQITIFFKKKLNNTQWINQVHESCRVAVNIRITHIWFQHPWVR